MKTIYILLLLISASYIGRAQNFNLTFEDTTVINQVYYTDSTLDPQHIWQIGVPNKPFFDSAYSPTHAMVTLLDSSLPPNVNASFIIKTDPLQYLFTSLSFFHRYDLEPIHQGGFIQFSIDTGQTWNNLTIQNNYQAHTINFGWTPYWDNIYDTLTGGNPFITGNLSLWESTQIYFPCYAEKTTQYLPLWFKFTVFSDSISTSYHAGWIIDNITFNSGSAVCGGINEINSSHLKVYPDPVVNGFTLSLVNTNVQDYELSIMDLMGRVLMSVDEHEKEVILRRGDITAGSYIIRVKDKTSGETMEKRLIFE